MTEVGRRLAELPPEQRAVLERLLLARQVKRDVGVRPRDRSRPAPLSPSQRRLWFMDQLAPGSPTYNAVVAFRARGPLDIGVLTTVIRRIVDRHEVLRTVLRGGDDPVQVVLDYWTLTVEIEALAGVAPEHRWARAEQIARSFCRRPYDLARDLPLRLLLVALGPDDHLVVIGEHHIAFDGWSDEILFAELGEGYARLVEGTPWSPPPLALQYADVAVHWADQGADPAGEQFWRVTLAGAPDHVGLPVDRPHPAVPDYAGRHVDVAVPAVGPALRALQAEHRATAYMVLSTAFAAAVFRWSGEGDLVLGTPMANRGRAEFEPLIGFFSNTVPVRIALDDAMTFDDAVDVFRSANLDAMDHQSVPFERIVDVSRTRRDPRRNPLFQVNVRVQQGGAVVPTLPGLDVEPVAIDLGFSRFDLAVDLSTIGDDVRGYLEYSTQLFDDATVADFVGWLQEFLADALVRPDVPLHALRFGPDRSAIRGRRRRVAGVAS